MATESMQYFGAINTEKTEEKYIATTTIDDNAVELDLHFELPELPADLAQTTNSFLANLAQIHQQNLTAIRNDYQEDGEALDYIRFYLDELPARKLKQLLGTQQENKSIPNKLLDLLTLIRVGVYPDAEDGFKGTFDYSIYIDGRPNNQVLAIHTDEKGEVDYISWES